MSPTRSLQLDTEEQVLTEIANLRTGYRQTGNWTLAQICWHVGVPLDKFLNPPEPMDLAATPEQAAIKERFVDYVIAHRAPPPYIKESPPQMMPPPNAGDDAIDGYIENLHKLKAYPHPRVMMGPVGPVTAEEFRICNLFHASHHLSFLEPVAAAPPRRVRLKFDDLDQVAADIQTLRNGYRKSGNWTLAQVCWHLDQAMQLRMKSTPMVPNTPEQDARKPLLEQVLATGALPPGLVAPDSLTPPTVGETAIDAALETIQKFKNFPGPITQHRLFGNLPDATARRLNLIHCAHHLSHLVPTTGTPS
ncbi:MAG: DUF1569 domain-containing protein [Burkholderiales bacterium]|nr:DUF1569 domain-containing protein [Phycisphaerae bacterium]